MIYQLSEIKKSFEGTTVLDIRSLTLEKGNVYGILGPNGAGKTTLLNILALLESPSTGSMRFMGTPVTYTERSLRQHRMNVVMVPQNPVLFTSSVRKNLEFGLKIRKIGKSERARIIDETLELVGLRHLANRQANRLSGGETQRIALARAIALSPEVILCDEPIANVDIQNQGIISDLLARINKEKGITLIFTTHSRFRLESTADDLIYLENGRLTPRVSENAFQAEIKSHNGGSVCVIQNQIESPIETQVEGTVMIRIDPHAIRVLNAVTRTESLAENQFRIIEIRAENGGIRLLLENNMTINVVLDRETYAQRRFLVGDIVEIMIPAEAITIV